uniref:Uncharacterized protein n=1 Tax=Caenorhabditis japonica TaxID=281687 RepID=A0A8R1EMH8_CAEJA
MDRVETCCGSRTTIQSSINLIDGKMYGLIAADTVSNLDRSNARSGDVNPHSPSEKLSTRHQPNRQTNYCSVTLTTSLARAIQYGTNCLMTSTRCNRPSRRLPGVAVPTTSTLRSRPHDVYFM